MQGLTKMKKKQSYLWIILAIVMVLGVAGCSNNDVNATTDKPDEAAAQAALNENNESDRTADEEEDDEQVSDVADAEIVLAGTRNIAPGENDAYYCSSILMVWEPLIASDESGAPIPKLAASYSANEDYTIWTFQLKEGVSFHDGEPFNADAVIANFDRMKLGEKSSNFYTMNIDTTYPGLEKVEKLSDYEIQLVFASPLPTLDYAMTNFGSAMYSPKNFDAEGNFNGLPMGTGPFKLIENVLDSYTVIARNDDYYGDKAQIAQIRIKVIPDPDTRYSALKSGEVMGVLDLGAIQPVMAMSLVETGDFDISYTPSTITHYIIVNGNKFPFNDVRMRQAVSLLIDRELILDSFYAGLGYPTVNVLNQMTPFYEAFDIPHDVEKAKSLAKEVLGDERVSVALVLRSGELNRYPNKEEAELLQAQLKEIGVDAEITILDNAAWSAAVKEGEYDLSLKIKGLSSAEPVSLFSSMMKTDNSLNKSWSFGYSNTEVDKLIEDVSGELDMAKREAMYNRLQTIAVEELPVIPYFNDVTLVAFNKKIEGYEAVNYGVTLDKVHWAGQ
ncbi:ABC transporter substrate-binding protein [Fusibacter paucivorans]|uniref:ABC transporter substrate-binding protein n=1 Tax=Fusibacter paucivorans TaxID=76009 RepID=A0ABS5PS09_9FIRM|nr:ABC transporter substrate-binding protein [Fusibacter paucivorans]MBS7527868.1 ABC transporter substrate-binding protein [Fusibacter paucivorans]